MPVSYPDTRRSDASYTLHAKAIPEPYDYLEDPSNAETKNFVAAQSSLFKEYMKSSSELCDTIVDTVTATQNFARTGNPSLHGDYIYYEYNTGLQNQNVVVRVPKGHKGPSKDAEVFLDPNIISADGTSALKSTGWSKSATYFAYSVSDKGSDWQHIHIRDARSKKDLEEELQWAKFTGISWWGDEGFFYTRFPELDGAVDKGAETDAAENSFVCFHRVGTPQSADVAILRLPEHPQWGMHAEVSDCGTYLLVSVSEGCEPHNLMWVAPLPPSVEALVASPSMTFEKPVNEFRYAYHYLGNDGDVFYFETTQDAPMRQVISMTRSKQWAVAVVVPERDCVLNHVALVEDTFLLDYLEDVKDVVYYKSLKGDAAMHKLGLPIASLIALSAERHSPLVSFKMASFLLPGRSFSLEIADPAGTLCMFGDDTVAGFDASEYTTEQRFYHSDDGTRIPMYITYKTGSLSETSPVLLFGYGGFNISLTPVFSPFRLMFIQHLGGVLAIPNIRGGGEYGQAWHDAGRRTHKENCFMDFVAAARYLHAEKIGSPATTAAMGRSNGGLLMGATTNRAPDAFACVICQVGVLDMYKFHKFTIGHAWISDYGNPDKEEDFKVVEKYSPIHNVKRGVKYPAVLVVTGDHDDRVVPLHSLKYVATMQHANPAEGGPFLARIDVAGGHGQGKPVGQLIREESDIYGFIAKNLGLTWKA